MNKIKLIILCIFISTAAIAQELRTNISVHDPVMIKQDDTYYLFCTGNGITSWSSKDMKNWQAHGAKLKAKDFSWAKGDAWASQVIEKDGKFYWYVTVRHATINGFAIGVAVGHTTWAF